MLWHQIHSACTSKSVSPPPLDKGTLWSILICFEGNHLEHEAQLLPPLWFTADRRRRCPPPPSEEEAFLSSCFLFSAALAFQSFFFAAAQGAHLLLPASVILLQSKQGRGSGIRKRGEAVRLFYKHLQRTPPP